MRKPVPLYHVFCVYRETPHTPEKTATFGLVDEDLLADVLVGFLNLQTPAECATLHHLAEWRVERDVVSVLPFQPLDRYVDAMMGRAFEWLGLHAQPMHAA